MMERDKMKIFLMVSLPLAVFFLFTVWVFYDTMEHHTSMPKYILVFFVALLIVFLLQFLIFRNKVLSELTELSRLQKAVEDQKKSARLLIRRDLELSRANEKLRELDEVKSNFISVVAHQLRTPLSGIKWTLNMILSGDLGQLTTEQRSFLMKGYESNDRMISLVNDMLGADRVESGKLKYQFVPVQIFDLMDNILYEMISQASKKSIRIEFKNKDRELPRVMVDAEKMRAVLQNLLENAIKYTPESGKIEIEIHPEGELVQVSIKDSGIGIPEAQAKNIFNRFFRAQNAIKMQTDGSGLGLFIAKSIVEKHGGTIWFESVQDKGTTFHFTIPIAR